jgi:hypothetical protein
MPYNSSPPPSRRAVLAALPLAACAGTPIARSADQPPQGLETPSESVMLSGSDDAGRYFTARLCRYPAYGVAWLWVHAHTPEGGFSFVDHAAPGGRAETPADGDRVIYADDLGVLRFERVGATSAPARASVIVRPPAGAADMAADFQFTPSLMREGLLPGRMEAFGAVEGELRIDGRNHQFRGLGQFHEQRQTDARFTTPFAFASLWGEGAATTLLQIPDDSGGYVLRSGEEARAGRVRIGPPGDPRALRIDFGPDDAMVGYATAVSRFTIPIYGQTWRGAFVTADLGGMRLRGLLNDWRADVLFA